MLKVGDIYPHSIDCPASDCARIVFDDGHLFHYLIIVSDPSTKEIEEINKGNFTLGLFTENLAMFMLLQYNSMILDSHLNAHRLIENDYHTYTSFVSVILIKLTSRQILAIKTIKLTDEMRSQIIHGANLQLQFLTKNESDEISQRLLRKYSSYEMMKQAKVKMTP